MELLEACHSVSKPNSPQEKSVEKHECGLLGIIVRFKMPSKGYRSAQMMRLEARRTKRAPFVETSIERQCKVMTLSGCPKVISTSKHCTNVVMTLFRLCLHTG